MAGKGRYDEFGAHFDLRTESDVQKYKQAKYDEVRRNMNKSSVDKKSVVNAVINFIDEDTTANAVINFIDEDTTTITPAEVLSAKDSEILVDAILNPAEPTQALKDLFNKPYENITEFETGGKKDLQGKLRVDLITPEMKEGLAKVLGFGSRHYGDRNWEQGVPVDQLLAAAERHMMKHLKGELNDEHSGLLHLEHALTNIGMAVTLIKRGKTCLTNT
jgi:hypothetical protein